MRPPLWQQLLVCAFGGTCFAAPFYRVHGWSPPVLGAFCFVVAPTSVFVLLRAWENRRR